VQDSALALTMVTGLALGSVMACAALSRDIRKGAASAILSKPVGRSLFFLAKYAGVAAVLLLFCGLLTCATLLAARTAATDFRPDWWGAGPLLAALPAALMFAGAHHFLARGPFVSRATGYVTVAVLGATAVSASVRGEALPLEIVPAAALIAMAVLVLTGLAVALATRLDVVPVLIICSVFFMLGLIADYLIGQMPPDRPLLRAAIDVLPNWQHFWAVDALSRNGVPMSYLLHAAGYGSLYLAGILCAGMVAFRVMEVK
jgi:hypothetical protein